MKQGRFFALLALLVSACGGETGASTPASDGTPSGNDALGAEQSARETPSAEQSASETAGGKQSSADAVDPGQSSTEGQTAQSSTASASLACPIERRPIADPDPTLLDTVERITGTYPIGGSWASPGSIEFTPSDVAFEGELSVSRRDGDLNELSGCAYGIEIPVSVTLNTDDGALAETIDGTVVLETFDEVTVDTSQYPFRAHLTATVDLHALSGSFAFVDDDEWTFGNATLSVELTPFGTRGGLGASTELKQPIEPTSGMAAAGPNASSLLSWHGDDVCAGESSEASTFSLYPTPSEARQALDAARELAATETYPAKYADGTETQVTIEIEPLTTLCATDFWASYWHFLTRAHLRTEDGRIDVTIDVTLDPGFALLHYNSPTEFPWAYPPTMAPEQIGHMDAVVDGYAHVGIESWFDLTPEPAGWVKVLGYADGACIDCEQDGGCSECNWNERVELLSLFIGAMADKI